MADKLDGSFSGLWTCELCGKTGTDCTCEHFDRGFARGKDKTFTDAELAAETWYAISCFQSADAIADLFEDDYDADNNVVVCRERMYVVEWIATGKDYRFGGGSDE
jgi:hypothetical protein